MLACSLAGWKPLGTQTAPAVLDELEVAVHVVEQLRHHKVGARVNLQRTTGGSRRNTSTGRKDAGRFLQHHEQLHAAIPAAAAAAAAAAQLPPLMPLVLAPAQLGLPGAIVGGSPPSQYLIPLLPTQNQPTFFFR